MKKILLSLILGLAVSAGAGYPEALKKVSNLSDQESKELLELMGLPGAELAKKPRLAGLLAENAEALELFRQAAGETNDGFLFSAKNSPGGTGPVLMEHLRLFRLLMISARINAGTGKNREAEKDLSAAAGFMAQISAQKTDSLESEAALRFCLQVSFPLFVESLLSPELSSAYLDELGQRLNSAAANRDYMRGAILEDAEVRKKLVAEAVKNMKSGQYGEKPPLLTRLSLYRFADDALLEEAKKLADASADEQTEAYMLAFRENDAEIAKKTAEKRERARLAMEGNRPGDGFVQNLKEIFSEPEKAKKKLVFYLFTKLEEIDYPDRCNLVTYYHLAANWLDVLRSSAAVKRYRRDFKRLPASLDKLVPKYLEAVPADVFDKGAPLKYLKMDKGFSVYGVGPNRLDELGRTRFEWNALDPDPASKPGDITFSER